MTTTIFHDPVPEKSSRRYRTTLVDHDGQPVDPASMQSIALTLRDVKTGTIINNRDAQSVLNTNGGTFSAGGVFTMLFSAVDTTMVEGASGSRHHRRATFQMVYYLGAENHEVIFVVQNLADVA